MTTPRKTRKPAEATKVVPRPETAAKPRARKPKADPTKAAAERILKVGAEQGTAAGQAAFVAEATAILTGKPVRKPRAPKLSAQDAAIVDETIAAAKLVGIPERVEGEDPRAHYEAVALAANDIAAMDRKERDALGKAELEAVRALARAKGLTYQQAKALGEVPTPVLDWKNGTSLDVRIGKGARKPGTPGMGLRRDPAELERMREVITAARTEGKSWAKVALDLEAAGIPSARGGKWWDTSARDMGKALGLLSIEPQLVAA